MDALTAIRHRDRALVLILEAERDQGMPERFDWKLWRRNRAQLVHRLIERRRWEEELGVPTFTAVVHRTVER